MTIDFRCPTCGRELSIEQGRLTCVADHVFEFRDGFADLVHPRDLMPSDAEFQGLWLDMMVEHHTGAVQMATTEQEDGQYASAIDLAGQIIKRSGSEVLSAFNQATRPSGGTLPSIYQLATLDGSCRTPIAGLAEIEGGRLRLEGLLLKPDGSDEIRGRRDFSRRLVEQKRREGRDARETGAGQCVDPVGDRVDVAGVESALVATDEEGADSGRLTGAAGLALGDTP